jgi:hypothetical protein
MGELRFIVAYNVTLIEMTEGDIKVPFYHQISRSSLLALPFFFTEAEEKFFHRCYEL